MSSEHNKRIREQIAALEKRKEGMPPSHVDYPQIISEIQALSSQLQPERKAKKWYLEPIGLLSIAISSSLVLALLAKLFGWI
jgi:hypothetical protein